MIADKDGCNKNQSGFTLLPDTIRIFVRDIHRARSFYRDQLGLPLVSDGADQGYLLFTPGGFKILIEACDPNDEEGHELVGRFVGLSFRVPDVQAAYRELQNRGVEFDGVPESQPWGGMLTHLVDPDRNILTLVGDAPATKA